MSLDGSVSISVPHNADQCGFVCDLFVIGWADYVFPVEMFEHLR